MLSRKPVRPSRKIELVSRNTNQAMATCWIQPPITDTVWPATYKRKRGLESAGGSHSCQFATPPPPRLRLLSGYQPKPLAVARQGGKHPAETANQGRRQARADGSTPQRLRGPPTSSQ